MTDRPLDAGALPFLQTILSKILGPGKVQRNGNYIDMLNPHRDDRSFGSFRIDDRTGKYWDFANSVCGFGATGLVGYLLGVHDVEASEVLGYFLRQHDRRPGCLRVDATQIADEVLQTGQTGFLGDKPAEPLWHALPQPELDALTLSQIFPGRPAPDRVDEYRNTKGEVIQRELRWNKLPWSKKTKVIAPLQFARPIGEGAESVPPNWVVGWASRIPVWNAEKLAENPTAPVLWVEGPSAARGAGKYLPDGVIVTTCAGGLLPRADLSVLAGRPVVAVWADHDEPGKKYQDRVVRALGLVSVRSVLQIPLFPNAKKGWDLADDPSEANTTEIKIRKILKDSFSGLRQITAKGPDMSVVNRVREDMVKAPETLLPSWSTWGADTAGARDVDVDALKFAMLVCASGPMAGVVGVSPRAGWVEEAALFGGIVGPSGSRKSPLLDSVVDPIRSEELRRANDYAHRLEVWEAEKALARVKKTTAPLKPARDHLLLNDTTPDSYAVLQAERNVGALEVHPEGSGLVASFTRYGKGDGMSAARAMMLQKHDCKRVWYSRRKIGDAPVLTLIASSTITTIQPTVLGALLASSRALLDGLAERFLWVYPIPKYVGGIGHNVSPEKFQAHEAAWSRAFGRIYDMAVCASMSAEHEGHRVLKLTDDASEYFESWRRGWLQRQVDRFAGELPGAVAKAPGSALRLALAHHAAEWAASDQPIEAFFASKITKETVELCVNLRAGWLEVHREYSEASAGAPTAERLATILARWACENRVLCLDTVTLRRHVRLPGLNDDKSLLMAFHELSACGWLAPGTVLPVNLNITPMIPTVMLRSEVVDAARKILKLA